MRALSIRQPYAELISPRRVACGDLRGIKKIEYRCAPTRIIGEPSYIYAPRKVAMYPTRREIKVIVASFGDHELEFVAPPHIQAALM